jgi:hypothetical protein
VLLAWFLATGAQWDVVQTLAWGKMFASYARTVPLGRALSMTFDPANMCSVCRAVDEAKHHDHPEGLPGAKADTKQVLILQAASELVLGVTPTPNPRPSEAFAHGVARACPPTPPPRAA